MTRTLAAWSKSTLANLSGARSESSGDWPQGFAILSAVGHPAILLGTSSFTATGWEDSFYPKRMRTADYLAFYAEHFHTVEVDSTFYACPSARTVSNWAARTPGGFVF